MTRSAGAIGRRLVKGIERQPLAEIRTRVHRSLEGTKRERTQRSVVQQRLSARGKAILFLADVVPGPRDSTKDELLARDRVRDFVRLQRRSTLTKPSIKSEHEPLRPSCQSAVDADDNFRNQRVIAAVHQACNIACV